MQLHYIIMFRYLEVQSFWSLYISWLLFEIINFHYIRAVLFTIIKFNDLQLCINENTCKHVIIFTYITMKLFYTAFLWNTKPKKKVISIFEILKLVDLWRELLSFPAIRNGWYFNASHFYLAWSQFFPAETCDWYLKHENSIEN